jgi:hypothetical protein
MVYPISASVGTMCSTALCVKLHHVGHVSPESGGGSTLRTASQHLSTEVLEAGRGCCYCYCYWGLIVQGSDYHPVGTERIVKNHYPRTNSAPEIPIIQGLRYLNFELALFGAFSSIRPVHPYRYFTANYYTIPIAYIPSRERNKVQYNIWDNCCLLKVHLLDSTKDWYPTIHRKLVSLIRAYVTVVAQTDQIIWEDSL